MQRVECAGLDQRFDRALVDAAAVDANAEVVKAGEGTPFATGGASRFPGLDDRLDRLLPRAFHGSQAVADHLVGDRFEAMVAAVDVRRLERETKILLRVFEQHLELVGVVHFHGHVGAEELRRVMHLQPARVIREQRVGGSMRLVEAVAGELLHQIEDLVGLELVDAVLRRAGAEDRAVLGHLLGLLLAHRAAQQVCPAQRIAAQDLRGLHHLLLVDHDAVGLAQHVGHQRMRILHFLAAVLARDEARDQVHRAGPVQRVERDQVFEPGRPGVAQHALHAAAFELEHRLGLAIGKQLVGGRVIERDVLEAKVLLALVAGSDQLARDLQDGQRRQPQEVELHQAGGLHVVLVVLAHGRLAARLLVQRREIGELARGDQHAAGMHADVARHAFELLRQRQQRLDVFFLFQPLGQHRLGLDRAVDRDVLPRLVRDQLADAVAEGVAHVQHPADVADRGARRHRAEGRDLAHRVLAVLVLDVVDHAVAVALAEVDVEVGHRHALRIQEALEQQVVLQRIEVGDLERIGDQRAGAGAAARPDRAAVVLRPVDEIAHDQEVAREPHLQDGVDLEVQPFQVARQLVLALRSIRIEPQHPLPQARVGGDAEVLVDRHAVRRGERGQPRLAQLQHQVAAACDFDRVGDGGRHVGEQRLHLGRRLEILLARKAPDPALVAEDLAFGDAHARFMRFVVIGPGELHRMGGDHRKVQPRGQLHRRRNVRLVVTPVGALQLQIEPVREERGQVQRDVGRARFVALHQRLADRASLRARQRDQAVRQLGQPFGPADRLIFHRIAGPGARQQLAKIEVPLPVLHQKHHARKLRRVLAQPLHHHFGAKHRLDSAAARFLVELDAAEQVAQVGDGQRRLAIGRGRLDGFVDAVGAVDDGEFGVQAQVDEHGCIVGNRRPLTALWNPHRVGPNAPRPARRHTPSMRSISPVRAEPPAP